MRNIISTTMNLGNLMEHLGLESTLLDAEAMRDLLIERGFGGQTIESIDETTWWDMAGEAARIAAKNADA